MYVAYLLFCSLPVFLIFSFPCSIEERAHPPTLFSTHNCNMQMQKKLQSVLTWFKRKEDIILRHLCLLPLLPGLWFYAITTTVLPAMFSGVFQQMSLKTRIKIRPDIFRPELSHCVEKTWEIFNNSFLLPNNLNLKRFQSRDQFSARPYPWIFLRCGKWTSFRATIHILMTTCHSFPIALHSLSRTCSDRWSNWRLHIVLLGAELGGRER